MSIDAQRGELIALASQRGLVVAGEFTDVVESGSDEHRPGLRCMVEEMRRRRRKWDTILLLDPAAATLQVCYRVPLHSGNKLASPGGSVTIPTIVARTLAKVA